MIKSINYLVDGIQPTPTAGELADVVRSRISDAEISRYTITRIRNSLKLL